MSRHSQPWNEEETNRLRSMLAAGKDYVEVAREIGRTAEAIEARAKRLRICNGRERALAALAKGRSDAAQSRQSRLDTVYSIFTDIAREGRPMPTTNDLAKALGIEVSTMRNTIADLINAGKLERVGSGTGSAMGLPLLGLRTGPRGRSRASQESHSALFAKPRKIVPVASNGNDQSAIAEFIAKNGVTKCPPMFVAESQAGDGFYRRAMPRGKAA